MYFDDWHTKSGDMRHVQLAAENFVRRGLRTNDQVALYTASSSESLDFTTDTSKLLEAIANLRSRARVFESSVESPRITLQDAYLIVNHLDPDAFNTALAAAKQCNCDDRMDYTPDCPKHQERVVLMEAEQLWSPQDSFRKTR